MQPAHSDVKIRPACALGNTPT